MSAPLSTKQVSPAGAKRVLITGASGLVGGRLCEVMVATGSYVPRAFIHTTGGAWRIARFPLDFFRGDLCDAKAVSSSVEGCDAVVHLARGDKAVMTQGLENVLRAAADHNVSRFVHVSSVAVYGNNPPPESVSEDAPARPTGSDYGDEKLAQEKLVEKFGRSRKLPYVILRPPNIYGPSSSYSVDTLERVQAGTLPMVDQGQNPCSLVYIDNLIEAILLALWKPGAVGETFFVTDSDVVTWGDWLREHAALAGVGLLNVASSDLVSPAQVHPVADSIRALPSVFLGGDLRGVLRQVPLVKSAEAVFYNRFLALPEATKQRMRLWVNGPVVFSPNGSSQTRFRANDSMISSQLRRVAHSSKKAKDLLGYTCPVSHREAMAFTEAWLRFARVL
jgi:nucleoside-diphosphate-sugar epimerase